MRGFESYKDFEPANEPIKSLSAESEPDEVITWEKGEKKYWEMLAVSLGLNKDATPEEIAEQIRKNKARDLNLPEDATDRQIEAAEFQAKLKKKLEGGEEDKAA